METLETLKHRIDTVHDLHAVVRTMKVLAAVSTRQYEGVLRALNEYHRTIELGLKVVLRDRVPEHALPRHEPPEALGAVLFGSDFGLCGRFNEDLVELALDKMNGFQVPRDRRRVLAVGARTDAALSGRGHPVEESFFTPGAPLAITATVRQILFKLEEWQGDGVRDVLLFYSQAGEPHMLHLLPVDFRRFARLSGEPWPSRVLPTYSMEPEALLAALIRQHLFVSLFGALAESIASEHQARLRAMQSAEKNIDERLEQLEGEFRQKRQDSITAEIFDIVAGYEAVTGGQI